MRTPYLRSLSIVGLAALGLVACGDAADKPSSAPAEADKAAQEAQKSEATSEGMMDKAKDMAKEAVEKVADAVTLDTSSVDAFKASLAAMKGQLSDEDQAKLSGAVANLAKKAVEDNKDDLMGMAKDMVAGDAEEGILKKFGDQLNGMNFEELLAFAG